MVGTDAGGVAALPARSLALVRAAQLLLAPQRLLTALGPWWQEEQGAGRIPAGSPCPQLLASDRPEQIFGPLDQALVRSAVTLDALVDQEVNGGF